MKIIKFIGVGVTVTSLIACTATAQKPSTGDAPVVNAGKADASQPLIATQAARGSNQIASPDNLSKLQGQITALQEQVIKLSSDSASILKLSQLLVAKAQVQAVSTNGNDKNKKQVSRPANNNASLKKVLKRLESITPSSNGGFGIVSSYTASKQWVLIRYDRQSGETWLADNSGWNPLEEAQDIDISQYDVHLVRADQDKKGYVASRIDQRTGETWWLNKNKWVVYE